MNDSSTGKVLRTGETKTKSQEQGAAAGCMMVYAIRFCGLAVLGTHLGNPAAAPDPVAEGYVHCKDPGHDEDSISREADALDHGPRDDSSRYDGEGP